MVPVKLKEKILREASYKHTGAEGGQHGYDFQDFVTVIEIIRTALSRPISTFDKVIVIQNAKESQVDDLHILDGVKRRHVQIKSDERLSWLKKLRREFRHDRTLFREHGNHLTLELCVRSDDLAATLNGNKIKHRLGFVKVTSVDIEWMDSFPSPEIIEMMTALSVIFPSDRELVELWNQLEGCWTRVFKRRGNMASLFRRAKLSTGGAVRSLTQPSRRTETIAAWIKALASDLLISFDGDKIIIQEPGVILGVQLDGEISDDADLLDRYPPESLIEAFESMGMFKLDDSDDDQN